MERNQNRYPWRFSLYLMAYYVTNSVYQGFITVYFKEKGLTTAMIGALVSAAPLVSIFTQPLWGSIGDRSKSRNRILRIMAACAAVFVLAFRFSDNFWWLLPATCLFAAFYTALQPMGDSIVLEALQQNRQPFGPIRMIGCVSFAISSMVVGYIVEGRINWTIYLTAILLGFVILTTYALPTVEGHQRTGRKLSIAVLFRQRDLVELLIFLSLLQMTMGYFYAFFSVHFNALPGGSSQLLGWCFFISALSEVPFLLVSDRLFDRIGAGRLMCISAVVLTLRWVSLGFLTNVYWVMATQVLHGWGFIVLTVSMAKYINSTVPDEMKARGQMLLSVIGFGVARVVGTFGGGVLADAFGYQQAFLVNGAISFLALILFAPRFMKRPPLNGAPVSLPREAK